LKKLQFALTGSLLFLLMACSKETVNKEVNAGKQTCFEFIKADAELTCFSAAMERIELAKDPAYQQNGPFTFFAPTDAAFRAAGLDLTAIKNYDKLALKKIIDGHILSGRLGGSTTAGFYKIYARCLDENYKPVLSRNYYGLFLNGFNSLSTADLGDGIVHKTAGVAFPGTTTLWETICSKQNLSIFRTAIEMTEPAPGEPPSGINFKKILQSGLPEAAWMESTVFCPTDEAFRTLGFQSPAEMRQLSAAQATLMLIPHIIKEYSFTADFLQSGAMEPGSSTLRMGSSIIFPQIIQANIKASNGVAHIIDQVILR